MDGNPETKQSSPQTAFQLGIDIGRAHHCCSPQTNWATLLSVTVFPHCYSHSFSSHFCSLHLFSPVTNNQKYGCPYRHALTGIAYIYYFPYLHISLPIIFEFSLQITKWHLIAKFILQLWLITQACHRVKRVTNQFISYEIPSRGWNFPVHQT